MSVYRCGTGTLTKTAEDVEGNCGQSGGAADEEEEEEAVAVGDMESEGEEVHSNTRRLRGTNSMDIIGLSKVVLHLIGRSSFSSAEDIILEGCT